MPGNAPEQQPDLQVITREGVRFSLPLSGLYRRFLAWLVDAVVVVLLSSLLSYLTGLFFMISTGLAAALQILGGFVISIGYRIALEYGWDGKTVGKHVLNIRVMHTELMDLSFYQVVIRNLARFVDSMPVLYVIGGLTCFFHPRNQRLGDIAGNTVVVYSPERSEPDVQQFTGEHHNSFTEHPHLEARLRKKTHPDEGRVAMQALIRRDRMDPEKRVELFEDIADHFREKVSFPDETTHRLTPEQYVRNVVDTLYRKRRTSSAEKESAF